MRIISEKMLTGENWNGHFAKIVSLFMPEILNTGNEPQM